MSSIPLKAGAYEFTPDCFRDEEGELLEGAPVIVLRHGTRMDNHNVPFLMQEERYRSYTQVQIRDAIISEMRKGWESEGLEHNITLLEQLWQAKDDLAAANRVYLEQVRSIVAQAVEDEEPDLPEAPELDFDEGTKADLEDLIAEVEEYSARVSRMVAANSRYMTAYPRMVLRLLLKSTSLDVGLPRKAGLITAEACEELLARVDKVGVSMGAQAGTAALQLLREAQQALELTEDEVKNSSAPLSGPTNPKQSAKQSNSKAGRTSKTRKRSAKVAG